MGEYVTTITHTMSNNAQYLSGERIKHYVDNRPQYDLIDYLYQLKEKVFKDNAEFATLVSQVATAVKACHVAHDEYSYDKNGTNMACLSTILHTTKNTLMSTRILTTMI